MRPYQQINIKKLDITKPIMDKTTKNIVKVIVVFVILLTAIIFRPFAIVQAGERGIVTRFGKVQDTVLEEGIHFRIPILEKVTRVDTKIAKYETSELSYSKDAQIIDVALTINYQIDPAFVKEIYTNLRNDYESKLISPTIKESIKAVIAQYTAQGLLDHRPDVRIDLKDALQQVLSPYGLLIKEVSITNFDFDDAYEAAVRDKQVAEQNALQQVNVTKSEEEKKNQEILKAQALAEKTRLEAQALASQQGQKVIEKIYAEAALKSAEKWNGVLPTQFVPGSTIPFINVK